MSIDKKGFRYRLSNVLAWVGSLGGGGLVVLLVVIVARWPVLRWEEPVFTTLAVYLGCALINYLMVGSLRLLPWKDIE